MPTNNETTTKFKVDISELKKGMQDAQRQIRLANAEFKAASSGMDDWGKSADGVSAKLKQLDTTLNSQKSILNALKEQYALVAREQGESSKGAQELAIKIANQQAAVNKTQKEIDKYTQTLKDLESGADGAGDDLNELADSAEDAGKAAEKAEGGFTVLKGALANLAAEGIKACASALADLTKELITDSTEAYAQFAAATGTATDAMGDYKEAINNVYKSNLGESLQDVAEKMAKVKEVTGELDASKLEDMTKKAITLEDTFDMDMSETLRGVQSLMDHFGLTSEQAFDLIASGAQNGLNYTDELGDNVAEYAGKFAEAGFNSEEYFQLLKNGADGGAYNLDKVNDAINEVTARLADGTIGDSLDMFSTGTQDVFKAWQNGEATQKDVIASIVSDIQNTTNEQEKMNLAAKAFGTMAEDGGTQFIEALSPVGDTFADVKGKAEELAAVKYDTPSAAIAGIGRTLKTDLLMPLVDKLMPHLNNLATWVTENLPTFIEKVKEFAGKAKEVVTVLQEWAPLIAGIGTAIATYFAVAQIANFITWIKSGAAALKAMEIAQAALNIVMSMNPIGLVIAAIAGLVAAFVILWNKSEAFREFWLNLWEGIKEAAKVVIDAIGNYFTDLWNNIKVVWSVVQPWFQKIWDAIKNAVSRLVTAVKNYFSNAWTNIKNIWSAATGFFSAIWDGIKAIFSVVASWFGSIFSAAWEAIKTVFNAYSSFFNGVWNGIKNIFNGVASWFGGIFSDAWNNIKNAFSNFTGFFRGLWDDITGIFKEIGTKMGDAISGSVKSAVNTVLNGAAKIINGFFDAINAAIGFINKIPGVNIGKIKHLSVPQLEEGGVLKKGQIGLLEGNGVEAVVPLEKNKKWIAKTAQDMSDALRRENVIAGNNNTANNYTFNQYNNSPKALSRLEIYRQTKNQLEYAKGV